MEHINHMEHSMGERHAGHDHGDGGCHGGHAMTFHTNLHNEILFNGWETHTALELFGSCVAIFLAGVLYEGFKYYREALHVRATTATGDSRVDITKNECGSNSNGGRPASVRLSILSCGHVTQTFLHIIQATVSYILMLIFMTYNVYLCLALVLGLGLGYFCFGWRKVSVVDPNEHCH